MARNIFQDSPPKKLVDMEHIFACVGNTDDATTAGVSSVKNILPFTFLSHWASPPLGWNPSPDLYAKY